MPVARLFEGCPRELLPRVRWIVAAMATCALIAALSPAPADGRWVVKGRGSGHGVGMSQYGALGFAQEGRGYERILTHYFRGTTVSETQTRSVRVLLDVVGSVPFTGAEAACGKRLRPGRAYSFSLRGAKVKLRRGNGSVIKGCGREGVARGGRSVVYSGRGAYRGKLIGRSVGGAVYAINKVNIEGYVKGVVANEVIPSWPKHALRAQAVAARSYALATRLDGNGYDLYDDTRSQVYGGRSSEEAATNRAARATRHEVVKHNGRVATTYFFPSSGGQTESSEFGFNGGRPRPYLKSVTDPFDAVAPVHRWRVGFSNSRMAAALAGLYQGTLREIKVLQTGRSPRIVRARVVGSRGSSRVSGDELRFRLGLRSTWARFRKR